MSNNVDMKRVQSILLRAGKSVAEILERHDIPYMLIYGTLLGAVRHKGFIPWDDDLDMMLFENSYDRAMEFLRSELPDDLFLEDENSEPLYCHAWPHVKDIKTKATCSLYPQDSLYSHHGVSVDLYIVRKMRRCDVSNYCNDENFAYLHRRNEKGLITPEDYSRRMARLQEARKTAAQEDMSDTHEGFVMLTSLHKFFELEEILPLKKYKFEDTEFWGPAKAEVILEKIYGDFMKFPPIEKRVGHYSSVEFL